jgi:outer membrane receptor protein involved in Fe transport
MYYLKKNLIPVLTVLAFPLAEDLMAATEVDKQEDDEVIIVLPASEGGAGTANKGGSKTENIDGEEIFLLQDFEVSAERDRGYYSANSLGGTRTNQLIKDTPMTISVVNQELLGDMNLTEIDSLADVVASAQSEGEGYSNRLMRFRGLLTKFQLFEFIPRQGPQNSYNVERVEVIRGANSLVYGQAAPGGKANFIGKKALFSNDFTKFEIEGGSNDLRRFAMDQNVQIGEQWAVRLMATHQQKKFSQEFKSNHFDGVTAAVNFRPNIRTSVNLHLEYYDELRNNPAGVYKDKTGNYGLTGIFENLPVTPDILNYLSPEAMQHIINYNDGTLQSLNGKTPQLDINSAGDLSNFYSAVAPNNSGTVSGPDSEQLRDGIFFIGDISHQFTENLSGKLAFAHEGQNADVLKRANPVNIYLSARNGGNLRDPEDEPNTIDPDSSEDDGKVPSPYMLPFWQNNHSTDDTIAFRSTVSWKKEIMGSQQQFLFGLDFDQRESEEYQYQEIWDDTVINEDGTWASSGRARDYVLLKDLLGKDWAGYYYDQITHISENFNSAANMGGGRNPISSREGDASFFALQRTRASKVATQAVWMAAQGRYLGGRLNTLVGARLDDIRLEAMAKNWQGGSTSEIDEVYTEVSPSLGMLFWLNQNIGVFANYAESIESPTGWKLDPTGKSIPAELGSGLEGGFKFEFLEGKISGQLIGYRIIKENDNLSEFTNAQLSSLYPFATYPEIYEEKDDGSIDFAPLGRNLGEVETQSQGVELDFYYNPTRSLSLFLGYAYVDAFFNDAPKIKVGGSVTPVVDSGERVPGTAHHSANFTTRYSFKNGKLKGWYVGSNIKYRSKSYYNRLYADIGSETGVGPDHYDGIQDITPLVDAEGKTIAGGDPVSYELWLSDNLETLAFVGWQGQLKKGRNQPKYSFQLTAANLFDARDLIATGNNARYTDGRRLSIKASIQF